jgi:hypothetical protein
MEIALIGSRACMIVALSVTEQVLNAMGLACVHAISCDCPKCSVYCAM